MSRSKTKTSLAKINHLPNYLNMKLILFGWLCFCLLTNDCLHAQNDKQSKILTKNAYWLANNKQVSLDSAKRGISTPDSLTLVLILDEKNIAELQKKELSFEFQWYSFGATRRYLNNSLIKKLEFPIAPPPSKNQKINTIALETKLICVRKNLKPGWWEVQIISYSDNGLLSVKNSTQFQILLK